MELETAGELNETIKSNDPEYFRIYYYKNNETIKQRQHNAYYTKKLNIPEKYIDIYKKHKKILKLLPLIDSLDKDAIKFFTDYYSSN